MDQDTPQSPGPPPAEPDPAAVSALAAMGWATTADGGKKKETFKLSRRKTWFSRVLLARLSRVLQMDPDPVPIIPGVALLHDSPFVDDDVTDENRVLKARAKALAKLSPEERKAFKHKELLATFDKKVCLCISKTNPLRRGAIRVMVHPAFDRVVLALILVNTVLLGLVDYSKIERDGPDAGQLRPAGRNKILLGSEPVFAVLYAVEMCIKLLAMGFRCYWADHWNKMDGVVTIVGVVTTSGIRLPAMSVLRTFRVLRPLRSLSQFKGMQAVVNGMIQSIPELISVVFVLLFVFFIFGIMSVQMFGGLLHARCRLTPWPVTPDWDPADYTAATIEASYASHRCLGPVSLSDPLYRDLDDEATFSVLGSEPANRLKSSSAWASPKECFWPLDPDDDRVCGFPKSAMHKCAAKPVLDPLDRRWCGSNYDYAGNARFSAADVAMEGGHVNEQRLMDSGTYTGDMSWGYIMFDNTAEAFMTIFQSITMEGWTSVMYNCMDAVNGPGPALFFVLLIVIGSFFVLNLILAVLENNYSNLFEAMEAEKEEAAREHAAVEQWAAASEGAVAQQAAAEADEPAPVSPFKADSPLQAVGEGQDGDDGNEERAPPRQPLFGGGAAKVGPEAGAGGDADDGSSASSSRLWTVVQQLLLFGGPSADAAAPTGLRGKLVGLVDAPNFEYTILALIILNTLTLATDHHRMDEGLGRGLEYTNFALTLSFSVEMALKLVAYGPRGYVMHAKDGPSNSFDGLIVVMSFVELGMAPPEWLGGSPTEKPSAITALRCFRLFRLFRLAKSWEAMNTLLDKMGHAVIGVSNLALLLLLFMYIFSLLGMQLFANQLRFDDAGYQVSVKDDRFEDIDSPRANFDTFLWAFVTVFQVLTGENWNEVMYDCRRASSGAAIAFFLLLIVVGMLIVMTLFLAILLRDFGGEDEDEAELTDETKDTGFITAEGKTVRPELPPTATNAPVLKGPTQAAAHDGRRSGLDSKFMSMAIIEHASLVNEDAEAERKAAAAAAKAAADGPRNPLEGEETALSATDFRGKALGCLGLTNPVRAACISVCLNPWFDRVTLAAILGSSIALAVDNPLNDPRSAMGLALAYLDYVWTVYFAVEMVVKVVALGFWFESEKAYLNDAWNVLDFVIVVISFIALGGVSALRSLRGLRALRALRPLRVIQRAPGLKLVVNALIGVVPAAANVTLICFLMFVMFGIICLQYFKGRFYSCQGDVFDESVAGTAVEAFLVRPSAYDAMDAAEREWFSSAPAPAASFDAWRTCGAWPNDSDAAPTSREVCQCLGADWDRYDGIQQSFNNIGWSLMTLFEISTTEGWVDVMLAAVDSRAELDMQPIPNNREGWTFFFIFYMLVSSFFMINIFIGVTYDRFMTIKKTLEDDGHASGGAMLLTKSQQEWLAAQQLASRCVPLRKLKPPAGIVGRACFALVLAPAFEAFILACILANTAVMALTFYGQSDTYGAAMTALNYIFAAIFTVEAALKLVATRIRYFEDSWNVFDFTIVVGTLVAIVANEALGFDGGAFVMAIRAFRLGRIVRIVKGFPNLRNMVNTLISTVAGLVNIVLLLALLFFIYAILGVQMFATIGFNGDLSPHANFRSFWMSMLTLFRFSTGENWNGFMYDVARAPDGCDADIEYRQDETRCGFVKSATCEPLDGCGTPIVYPYLLSFTIIVTFVGMNLFISVILDGFQQQKDAVVKPDDLEQFREAWAEWDPEATQYVHPDNVLHVLQQLRRPWGFGGEGTEEMLRKRLLALQLPLYKEGLFYYDVFLGLTTSVMIKSARAHGTILKAVNLKSPELVEVRRALKRYGKKGTEMHSGDGEVRFTIHHDYAAMMLQRNLQVMKANRQAKKEGAARKSARKLDLEATADVRNIPVLPSISPTARDAAAGAGVGE